MIYVKIDVKIIVENSSKILKDASILVQEYQQVTSRIH